MGKHLQTMVTDRVAEIMIDRSDKLNAIGSPLLRELRAELEHIAAGGPQAVLGGHVNPTLGTLAEIAAALGMRVEQGVFVGRC